MGIVEGEFAVSEENDSEPDESTPNGGDYLTPTSNAAIPGRDAPNPCC
jgi:hypothetical protein